MAAVHSNNALEVFTRHVPAHAVDYCYQLWSEFQFKFRVSKKRNSKLGDYRYDPRDKSHQISVNNNLNKYAFLITYVHEVAHLVTQMEFGGRVKSHGKEWKMSFKKLMLAVLNDKVFPDDILSVLAKHMKNPKATSTSDKSLHLILNKYNPPSSEILLRELSPGDKFLFNKRTYQKLEVRRTRSVCLCIDNSKKYLISDTAPVRKFKNQ